METKMEAKGRKGELKSGYRFSNNLHGKESVLGRGGGMYTLPTQPDLEIMEAERRNMCTARHSPGQPANQTSGTISGQSAILYRTAGRGAESNIVLGIWRAMGGRGRSM